MLTIYGTHSCAACKLTMNVLQRSGAPFEVVYLEDHPDTADELRAAGHQTLPVVAMAGKWWAGFRPDKLREAITYLQGDQ